MNDLIKGFFEAGGGLFILLNIRKVLHDRSVRGVAWPAVGFFTAAGLYNEFFFPMLGCWIAFAGNTLVLLSNTVYLLLLLRFRNNHP